MRHLHVLDLDLIRNFMLVLGPISLLFDFIIFYIMLVVLNAGEKLSQTAWFIESLCTPILVIFVISARGSPLRSTAHPMLVVTSLTIIAIAALLPLMSIEAYLASCRLPSSSISSWERWSCSISRLRLLNWPSKVSTDGGDKPIRKRKGPVTSWGDVRRAQM
jgi:hypothetical protein